MKRERKRDPDSPSEDEYKPATETGTMPKLPKPKSASKRAKHSSGEDIKPAKKKGGPQPYAPGAKTSLAEMIVRIGIAGLPNHAEVCAKTGLTPTQLKTQLDPRWGVRRELSKCAESQG